MLAFRSATQSLRLAARPSLSNPLCQPRFTSAFTTSALRLQLDAASRKKIDEAVHAHPLVVFMKGTPDAPMCGFSRAVVQIMEVQGVKPEALKTYNVLDSSELREQIKLYSSWPTIPQVFIKGDFVGGCDLVLNMHQSGELEQLLSDAGVIDAPAASASQGEEKA